MNGDAVNAESAQRAGQPAFAGGVVLAFDTASETLALAVGRMGACGENFELLAAHDAPAPRQANRRLLERVEALLTGAGLSLRDVDAVVAGRGPGSFTGVRIGIATAKGIACAAGLPLFGASTLDAVAWHAHAAGVRGRVGVLADAMRKEVYPVRYELDGCRVVRLDADAVAAPADVVDAWAGEAGAMPLCGNGLAKYRAMFEDAGFACADEELWTPTGEGLLRACAAALAAGEAGTGDAAALLPVYTRLSDAEENERIRAGLDPRPARVLAANGVSFGTDVEEGGGAEAAPAPSEASRAAWEQAGAASAHAAANGAAAASACGDAVADMSAADSDAAAAVANPAPAAAANPAPAADAPAAPFILAVESSCDETAVAVVDGKRRILSSVVASQIDFHTRFGGVVPEIASRKHVEAIVPVAQEALAAAGLSWAELSAVAATAGPGLVGSLVVGLAFAKGAAYAAGLPFIGVNHLEGHLYANLFTDPDLAPPFVALLVSGGHTMLVHVRAWGDYETIGSTLDDAVGEAFDKVAKALGLGYPGGPVLSRYAQQGDPQAIHFPRSMLHSGDLSFSLSGLKTAVITYIRQQEEAGMELNVPDLAASFQAAVIDVQVAKAIAACEQAGVSTMCVGGGVASNAALRDALEAGLAAHGIRALFPPAADCSDNAAMIAAVALDLFEAGEFTSLDADPQAHMPLRCASDPATPDPAAR